MSLATMAPSHHSRPCSLSVMSRSGASPAVRRARKNSPSRPFIAAARRARSWMPAALSAWDEAEAVQLADDLAADGHAAGIVEHDPAGIVLAQMAHQHRGAPVDEALGQPLMQRVGEPVFHGARYVPANARCL